VVAHAGGNPGDGDRVAEHAVAAGRFAQDRAYFDGLVPARSRRLNGNPLGGKGTNHAISSE
jgi:hypothetical protein